MWCECCKEECTEVEIDIGIGPYECHGTKGVDRHMTKVSDCCNSLILVDDPWCSECQEEPIYDDGLCLGCYLSADSKAA